MKISIKTTVIAMLMLIILAACVPPLPARNQTADTNNTVNATVQSNSSMQTTESETAMEETAQTEEKDLRDVPRKEVTEGELVSFPNLKAVDPDGDPIKYTFTSPLSEKGTWQTKEGDAGEHLITITASDGVNTVEQQVLVVVNSKNKPPVIELSEPIEAKEGETFVLPIKITDPEGDSLTVTYTGWMTSTTKEVSFEDAGLHKVVVSAKDGTNTIQKEIIVSVKNTNRAPEFNELDLIKIKEGQKAIIKPQAKDPDGDAVRFVYEAPIDATGSWQTSIGDAGEYEFIVTATDGELESEQLVAIVVEAINRPPIIELASPVNVEEGDTVTLNPKITDPEGDTFTVSYSGWMVSNSKKTNYEDSGNHKVNIQALDKNGNEAELEIIVIVADTNRAPVFGAGSFS